jgi:predicted ATP-binding protein involved in virulence
MKISHINIKGLGGIDALELSFDERMNIICGPNGVGKSTVLDAIAHCFVSGNRALKRNALVDKATIAATFNHEEKYEEVSYDVVEFSPNSFDQYYGNNDKSSFVILFRVNRTVNYASLDAVSRDLDKQIHILWEELKSGVNLHDIKNWFVNRYLYSAHENALTAEQIDNFNLAKKCFSILDADFEFSHVNASSNEIMVKTPGGIIYYEYLSSGFKSCLSIIFAIIKEVEYRFVDTNVSAEKFSGMVLIDELEIHLHPVWQSRIASVLLNIFPNIQFITTTHSPHIIQSAEPNQIKVLERKEGKVGRRDIPTSKHGFKSWTLDEVLTDVMGMEDTRSEQFIDLIESFGRALDQEDLELARSIYQELDCSLHPNNHMRKLLKLQLAEIEDRQL